MIARTCRTCAQPFEISAEEWAYLQDLHTRHGWRRLWPPVHCTGCRMFRRVERYEARDDGRDEERRCITCGAPFLWTAGEKRYYAERGYARPRRCQDCRSRDVKVVKASLP